MNLENEICQKENVLMVRGWKSGIIIKIINWPNEQIYSPYDRLEDWKWIKIVNFIYKIINFIIKLYISFMETLFSF